MTTSTSQPSSSSETRHRFDLGRRWCHVVTTGVDAGSFAVDQPAAILAGRRRKIVDAPWTWLRQVHGNKVVEVADAGQHAGVSADGAWTATASAPLAVTTADCAPVVLLAEDAVAVVHAGWRGALDGVIDAAAAAMLAAGHSPRGTFLGPCIGVGDYAFSEEDLVLMSAAFGSGVLGTTDRGQPALDMTAVVIEACARSGWPPPDAPPSTAGDDYFSHRVRKDTGRQTTVAWLSPSPTT